MLGTCCHVRSVSPSLPALIEAGVGYPDVVYRAIGHPVTWIGRLIAWCRRDVEFGAGFVRVQQRRQRHRTLVVAAAGRSACCRAADLAASSIAAFRPSSSWLLIAACWPAACWPSAASMTHVARGGRRARARRPRGGPRRPCRMIVGRDTGGARRGRRLPRRDREPGRELLRRRRGAVVLAGARRPAGRARLQGDQHRRQHDRPQDRAVHRLRLGGGALDDLVNLPASRLVGAVAGAGGGVAARPVAAAARWRAVRRDARQPPLAQCRLAGSRDGRRARRAARRARASTTACSVDERWMGDGRADARRRRHPHRAATLSHGLRPAARRARDPARAHAAGEQRRPRRREQPVAIECFSRWSASRSSVASTSAS